MIKSKLLLAVAIIGIAISVYLTIEHYAPGILVCPGAGQLISCATDLGSVYATVLGVPIALGALAWFIVVLVFALREFKIEAKTIWSLFGVGGVTYSVAAMHATGKICIYCTALDILIVLTILVFALQGRKPKQINNAQPQS